MSISEQDDQPSAERRLLRMGELAGLGVALAVAGSFAPWGLGLDQAGWGGMLIAFGVVITFYLCLLLCLGKLAERVPGPGGGQAFAAHAFGPLGGFLAGAAASVEFLCSIAALSALAAIYLQATAGVYPGVTVIILFLVAVVAHLRGAGEAVGLMLFLSAVTAAGVAAFVATMGLAAPERAFSGLAHVSSVTGIWLALPFTVPFFMGIEGLPLAAADAQNPLRDIPRAMLVALTIVGALGFAVLLAGPAGGGAEALRGTTDTIMAALSIPSAGVSVATRIGVGVAAFAGLCASFFGVFYACSRQIHAMAAAGELPRLLERTNRRGAPVPASIVPAAIGAILALSGAIDQLIVVLVAAASIFYLLMFASLLALSKGDAAGKGGARTLVPAYVGIVLGLVIFSACVASNIVWSALGVATFALLALYRWISVRRLNGAGLSPV